MDEKLQPGLFIGFRDEVPLGAAMTRRVTRKRVPQAPANVLLSTLRRPTECNADRADDFVGAVENLCIIRAKPVKLVDQRHHFLCKPLHLVERLLQFGIFGGDDEVL